MKRKRNLSESQKLAIRRNWNKRQIMGQISSLNTIIYNDNITSDESEKLKVVQDFLREIINNWKSTI